MKLLSGTQILGSKNLEKKISKKILLANTSDKHPDKKILDKAFAISNDPYYNDKTLFINPDIRYRNYFNFSPLANIDYRNALLMFSENKEIKKAVSIIANEIVVLDSDNYTYPVRPVLNLASISDDKQKTGQAIIDYFDNIFYPKLWQFLNFKKGGLNDMLKEFLICGKIAYEIIFDNINSPKDIIGLQPIDASTLQKFKDGDYVYYVQKSPYGDTDRVLHENQVILVEWNKYDFGYVSYVDGLRMSFNIMRSMQTSKILWFATKSQVRMHIKYAFGDVSREEAIQRLSEARNDYTNTMTFSEDGQVLFNNTPNNSGYREFFTAETTNSGTPEIEEVVGNGPDLTETDSLTHWEKLFWNDTGIPYDRIDPQADGSWGFLDVEAVSKTEIIFAKQIEAIRQMVEDIFLKPLIIQLTLKEVEIGIDLTLLDNIRLEWVTYNKYEKIADLELLSKKIELVSTFKELGEVTDASGNQVNLFPIGYLVRKYLDISETELKLIDEERKRQNIALGFTDSGVPSADSQAALNGEPVSEPTKYNSPFIYQDDKRRSEIYKTTDEEDKEKDDQYEDDEEDDEEETAKTIEEKENDDY